MVPHNGLSGLFGLNDAMLLESGAFEEESAVEERRRWEQFVPLDVLDRNRGQPNAWWAEEQEDATSSDSGLE